MANLISPPTPKSPTFPDTLLSVTALARFEFEPGRGNEGTKIMMVEWKDDDPSRQKSGSWQVSWAGKRTVFPADDRPSDNIRRVYFLLPPGSTVPPHITLSYHFENQSRSDEQPLKMSVNPLPAIFTPELGATAKASGKKGVLHTIWAKKRLQVLENEITHEENVNPEGIALEMAVSEKEWIEKNFGVQPKPTSLDLSNIPKLPTGPASPSLQSPRSPGGRRLSEKLKGLSIGTSDKDLAGRGINMLTREVHPLSPETSDMAYSSFGSFRTQPLSPKSATASTTVRKVVAQNPPDSIRQQQMRSPDASLDFVSATKSDEVDDDLFAIALSPRSPDLPKSPFSMSSSEAGAFAKIKGE